MSPTHDRHPDEEEFHLVVEVPGDVRHDPIQLREWLEGMAVDLANSESVDIEESRDQTGASDSTDWVQVKMLVRPCGGRFPADDDDDQGEDDDGPGDDFGVVVHS